MLKSSASRPTRRNYSLHGVLTDIPSCSARPPFPNGSCSEVQKAAARERQSHLCCELWRIQQESDCTWAPRIPSSPPLRVQHKDATLSHLALSGFGPLGRHGAVAHSRTCVWPGAKISGNPSTFHAHSAILTLLSRKSFHGAPFYLECACQP